MKFALHIPLLTALSLIAASGNASELILHVTDSQNKALNDVILYAIPDSPQASNKSPPNIEIEQKDLTFIPLVTVIQTGSRITFPNHDKVRHHIYSYSPAKRFDQKLYSGESAAPQVFDKAGTVVLGCNIHDSMLAYIKVVDTPYFAKTDAAGNAQINMPNGTYSLKAWHYNMAATEPISQRIQIKGTDRLTPRTIQLDLKHHVINPASAVNVDY